MSKDVITAAKEGILLNLKVSPGAKHTGISGPYGESAVKLRVAAPPTQGRARTPRSRATSPRYWRSHLQTSP